jgi:GT2 family glycosyltransferase
MIRQLHISIVLYHNGDEIRNCIDAVLACALDFKLFLIDNSETDELKHLATDPRIEYIFNDANLGYGAAHNIGLQRSLDEKAKYHLVMNPDISFEPGTLEHIYKYMERHPKVGSLMPKVFYEDGSVQRLCKLLPTPFNLIGRRFFGEAPWAQQKNAAYELHHFDYNTVLNTPSLSGCFMFIRTSVLRKTGLFDPQFFMYLEDYDLNRRIHRVARTEFYPHVSVVHGHKQESYKNGKLLKIHVQSAVKYFNKWGWLRDEERDILNSRVLDLIEDTVNE